MDIKNIALSNQNKILLQELNKKEKIRTNLPKENNSDYTLELNSIKNSENQFDLSLIEGTKNNSFKNFNSQIDVFAHILGLKNSDNNDLTIYEKVQ